MRREGERVVLVDKKGVKYYGTVLFDKKEHIAITLNNGGSLRINKNLLERIEEARNGEVGS